MSDLSLLNKYGFIDELGNNYGQLTVIEYTGSGFWLCLCDCGNKINIKGNKLRNGTRNNCGYCVLSKITNGQKYGKLLAIKRIGRKWLCCCECGVKIIINTSVLLRIRSCGCTSQQCHGHARNRTGKTTLTYNSWQSMKKRCLNPKAKSYANYGGRGITIHQEWIDSFHAFLRDMGERPEGTTLDRIKNDGNYEPGNCRWATSSQQNRNQRRQKKIIYA
jgi:hypothetical protein